MFYWMSRVEGAVTTSSLRRWWQGAGCDVAHSRPAVRWQSHCEPVPLGWKHHKYFPAVPIDSGRREEQNGHCSRPCALLEKLRFSISLLPPGRLEPAGVECLPLPCHFCSAKPPAGSALAKSFLPGAEVAKKIGMCLVFQHGFSSLFARSNGGWGWGFL